MADAGSNVEEADPTDHPTDQQEDQRGPTPPVPHTQTNHVEGSMERLSEGMMDDLPDSMIDNEEKPLSQMSYSWRKDEGYKRKCRYT